MYIHIIDFRLIKQFRFLLFTNFRREDFPAFKSFELSKIIEFYEQKIFLWNSFIRIFEIFDFTKIFFFIFDFSETCNVLEFSKFRFCFSIGK